MQYNKNSENISECMHPNGLTLLPQWTIVALRIKRAKKSHKFICAFKICIAF